MNSLDPEATPTNGTARWFRLLLLTAAFVCAVWELCSLASRLFRSFRRH